MEDVTLVQLFAQMDRHLARQDEILAHHSVMFDRMDERDRQLAAIMERQDDRGRQHTDAMLHISGNLARVTDILDRSMQRLETQQTQLGEILGSMAVMLTRMDEHTTMIAQILSQFQQGRNGH